MDWSGNALSNDTDCGKKRSIWLTFVLVFEGSEARVKLSREAKYIASNPVQIVISH